MSKQIEKAKEEIINDLREKNIITLDSSVEFEKNLNKSYKIRGNQ